MRMPSNNPHGKGILGCSQPLSVRAIPSDIISGTNPARLKSLVTIQSTNHIYRRPKRVNKRIKQQQDNQGHININNTKQLL